MAAELSTLRVKSEKLGSVEEIVRFLKDFEFAYNSIYAFHFLVETAIVNRSRARRSFDERLRFSSDYLKEFGSRKDFPTNPFLLELLWELNFLRQEQRSVGLLELQDKVDINRTVLPSEKLIISRVNIQSPGFWEFMGSLNPLQQIREYLKDRHERVKDRKYRSRQEEMLGDLSIQEKQNDIVSQQIKNLRDLGYSEVEIRQMVLSMIIKPLNELGSNQDRGLIDGIDEQ